jgi:hypothetical protein
MVWVAPVVLDGSARSDHSFPFIQWNILHLLFVGWLDLKKNFLPNIPPLTQNPPKALY